jgi:hypothetical protein
MKPARALIFTHASMLIVGAALCFIWTSPQRSELAELRAQNVALHTRAGKVEALQAEIGTLRNQNSQLSGRMPDARELAQLRAAAAERQRLKQELQALRATMARAASAAATSPSSEESVQDSFTEDPATPFTMSGTAQLAFGETVITGGWAMEPGQRGFVLVTPQLLEDGNVLIESRVVGIPEALTAEVGLSGLAAASRNSESHAVTDPGHTAELLETLQGSTGVELLSAPRVVTAAGTAAEISVLDAEGNGMRLRFNPLPEPGGRSLALDMNLNVDASELRPAP